MSDALEEVVPCCLATVWKRDCLRRTGRGRSGFSMHYNKMQCSRPATHDGRCWQHAGKQRYVGESDYFHKVTRKSRRGALPSPTTGRQT